MRMMHLVACVGFAGLFAVSACGPKEKKKRAVVPTAEQKPKTEEEKKADEAAQVATKTLKEIGNRSRQAAGQSPVSPTGTSLDDYNNTPSHELLVKKDPEVVKELVQVMDENLVTLRARISAIDSS